MRWPFDLSKSSQEPFAGSIMSKNVPETPILRPLCSSGRKSGKSTPTPHPQLPSDRAGASSLVIGHPAPSFAALRPHFHHQLPLAASSLSVASAHSSQATAVALRLHCVSQLPSISSALDLAFLHQLWVLSRGPPWDICGTSHQKPNSLRNEDRSSRCIKHCM
jgi:hypothetical protein